MSRAVQEKQKFSEKPQGYDVHCTKHNKKNKCHETQGNNDQSNKRYRKKNEVKQENDDKFVSVYESVIMIGLGEGFVTEELQVI